MFYINVALLKSRVRKRYYKGYRNKNFNKLISKIFTLRKTLDNG